MILVVPVDFYSNNSLMVYVMIGNGSHLSLSLQYRVILCILYPIRIIGRNRWRCICCLV